MYVVFLLVLLRMISFLAFLAFFIPFIITLFLETSILRLFCLYFHGSFVYAAHFYFFISELIHSFLIPIVFLLCA